MLTTEGPKTLEFNARFGDPKASVLLLLLEADLVDPILATTAGTLAEMPPLPPPTGTAVAVVLAAAGYPAAYQTGVPDDVLVFHGGTRRDEAGRVVTAGGRVLTVVGRGPDLTTARERAYAGAAAITFQGKQLRRDIAGTARSDARAAR